VIFSVIIFFTLTITRINGILMLSYPSNAFATYVF